MIPRNQIYWDKVIIENSVDTASAGMCGYKIKCDHANLQTQLTETSHGQIGADVCHLYLHKTMSIPHDSCHAPQANKSIRPITGAPYSSAGILTIPWMYIKLMGNNGLEKTTCKFTLTLNANYMGKKLEKYYKILYSKTI